MNLIEARKVIKDFHDAHGKTDKTILEMGRVADECMARLLDELPADTDAIEALSGVAGIAEQNNNAKILSLMLGLILIIRAHSMINH